MESKSVTAQYAAAHRAYHHRHIPSPILQDNMASWLLEPPLSTVLKYGPLRWLFWRPLYQQVQPMSTFVVVRSRYTEDGLMKAVEDNCGQYVILGAGLDSWALRSSSQGVKVFELDHPLTQQRQHDRILEWLGALPSNLILRPIDFEKESISAAVLGLEYDPQSKVYVSWLGTICYLTLESIQQTFSSLAQICAPGSRLVFDYFEPKSAMSPEDLRLYETLDEGGTKRGEPMRTLLNAADMADILSAAGFTVVEDIGGAEISGRYLKNRTDGLSLPGVVRRFSSYTTSWNTTATICTSILVLARI